MGKKEIENLLISAANTFLIGEGPTIAIISAFLPDLTSEENLKRHALLKEKISMYDGLYLFDLLGSWDYSTNKELLEKSVVVSGLSLIQILNLVRAFEQKAYLLKDWNGMVFLKFEDFNDRDREKTILPKELLDLKVVKDPFDSSAKIVSFKYPNL